MRKILALAAILLCSSPRADAEFINGSFEGGLTGWETAGIVGVVTSSVGSGPTDGSSQVLLETSDAFANSADVFELEEVFLGLPAGALDAISSGRLAEGSAIKQSFQANAGEVLSFDWNFLTDEFTVLDPPPEPDFNDFAFVRIVSLAPLADTLAPDFALSPTAFAAETGFRTFAFTIPSTGTYTLSIGVMNVGDGGTNSGLLVDNVRLTAVPEPSGLTLSALGGFCVAAAIGGGRIARRGRRPPAMSVAAEKQGIIGLL